MAKKAFIGAETLQAGQFFDVTGASVSEEDGTLIVYCTCGYDFPSSYEVYLSFTDMAHPAVGTEGEYITIDFVGETYRVLVTRIQRTTGAPYFIVELAPDPDNEGFLEQEATEEDLARYKGVLAGSMGEVARNVKKIYLGVDGVSRRVRKAYIGDKNNVARLCYEATTPIGKIEVGETVKLAENGVPVEYLIVHQGRPSTLYDTSCDGTWLLHKDIFETRRWHSSNTNDWANSTLKTYLDSTFLARFDANIQSAIKQVKIPYRHGPGTSMSVNSGANGLSCKIFLLSGYEMGWTNSDNRYFPPDGAKLSYFTAGTSTDANNKRIGYLNGSATYWWLRSPLTYSSINAWLVHSNGSYDNYGCSSTYGVRPALVLPSSLLVSDDGTILS